MMRAGRRLAELCQEGAARHGDDVAQSVGYVQAQIEGLPAAERATLLGELGLLLGDQAPLRGTFTAH